MSTTSRIRLLAGPTGFAIAATVLSLGQASASVIVGDSVVGDAVYGKWILPVTSGETIDAITRAPRGPDPGPAVYTLGSAVPASSTTITWGKPVSGSFQNSVTFTGIASIPASKATTDFPIGSFSYTNGSTSNQIYGATLALFAVGIDGNIPIGFISFTFNQTFNDGNAKQNADWLEVEGVNNTSQTYEGATFISSLNGVIVGDPQFVPAFFSFAPDQSGNGFLGGPTGGVPEPSTWAMLLLGFAGLGFMGWRGSRRATAHAG
jgi:hypothetical protein